jgi:chorismate mutase
MCAREIPVPGALPRVVRVLVHCYPPEGIEPQHVYLGDAVKLRLDLQGAQ